MSDDFDLEKLKKKFVTDDFTYEDLCKMTIERLLKGEISKEQVLDSWKNLINEIHEPIRERLLVKALSFFLSQGDGIVVTVDKDKFLIYSMNKLIKSMCLDQRINGKDIKDDFLVSEVTEYDDDSVEFREISLN